MMPLKRLKTLLFALFTALSLGTAGLGPCAVNAAGTLPLAMAQQIDINGKPLAGCQVTFYVAGTVGTLQQVFGDFGLTTPISNPLTCDQAGRVPMFWLADGLVHVRLTDAFGGLGGVPVLDTTMQVLGPSSGGGGGGGTVDPTTVLATGDLKWRLDKTPLSGWVRINGLTIGSATSGASERANADTQALFIYIWTNFSQPSTNIICPVVGGLGASALADFNANKKITLEDARARAVMALDDMGNSALGGYAGVPMPIGNPTFGGSFGGSNTTTLNLLQLPTGITSTTVGLSVGAPSAAPIPYATVGATITSNVFGAGTGSIPVPVVAVGGAWSGATSLTGPGVGATSNNTGGQAFPSLPRFLLGTVYWKL